jgi:hypothetical protein
MQKLDAMMGELSDGSSLDELVTKMETYEGLSLPHFKQEEAECLPLMRAYFTHKEIAPKVEEILSHGPKVELGSFIACMVRTPGCWRGVCVVHPFSRPSLLTFCLYKAGVGYFQILFLVCFEMAVVVSQCIFSLSWSPPPLQITGR